MFLFELLARWRGERVLLRFVVQPEAKELFHYESVEDVLPVRLKRPVRKERFSNVVRDVPGAGSP